MNHNIAATHRFIKHLLSKGKAIYPTVELMVIYRSINRWINADLQKNTLEAFELVG